MAVIARNFAIIIIISAEDDWIIIIYVLLLASEWSEWDAYRGNTIENWGYLFI